MNCGSPGADGVTERHLFCLLTKWGRQHALRPGAADLPADNPSFATDTQPAYGELPAAAGSNERWCPGEELHVCLHILTQRCRRA